MQQIHSPAGHMSAVSFEFLDVLTESCEFSRDQFPIKVGRSRDMDLRIQLDKMVSRIHCTFRFEDDKLMVRDEGSKHGIIIDGKRVLDAEIPTGTIVALGLTRFRVVY
jgi:pSer/pThr/pTyr-binding forkhead associated (FHA) protein